MQRQFYAAVLAGSLLLGATQAVFSETTAPAQPAATALVTTPAVPAATEAAPQGNSAIVGQVTATAPAETTAAQAALSATDYLKINNQEADLGNHSKKKYHAVSITLKNNQGVHLEVLQGEVVNGLDETVIAQQEQQSREKKKSAAGFLMRTVAAAPGIGLSFAGVGGMGYQGVAALARTSQALNAASSVVSNVPAGTAEISGQFVKKLNNVIISPNQTFTFKTLLPAGSDPQLKLIFKNLQTNQVMEL